MNSACNTMRIASAQRLRNLSPGSIPLGADWNRKNSSHWQSFWLAMPRGQSQVKRSIFVAGWLCLNGDIEPAVFDSRSSRGRLVFTLDDEGAQAYEQSARSENSPDEKPRLRRCWHKLVGSGFVLPGTRLARSASAVMQRTQLPAY